MQIPVPPDLGDMKDTVMFGLTKKQLVFFVIGGLIGLPVFFKTMGTLGSSNAALLMLACMLPFFMLGIYQKNGYSLDILLIYMLRHKFSKLNRPFETDKDRKLRIENVRKERDEAYEQRGSDIIYKTIKFFFGCKKLAKKTFGKIGEILCKKPY